jgi:glutamate racemase
MIGVFDSGFGGLTVLHGFLSLLPEYDYMYLGDSARAPYGNRPHKSVKRFTEDGVLYLMEHGCDLIIIACNTASADALREIQDEYLVKPKVADKKILGVIRPMVEYAGKISKNGRIGVVGTKSTIKSKSYENELHKINPQLKVSVQACPLLVPLIEEGWADKPETRMILKKYLLPLKSCNIDTLILGCTHYPFLYKDFCRIMGKNVQIPHPGEVIADSLKEYLKKHPEIESRLGKDGKRFYMTTDDTERFKTIGENFLGSPMNNIQKVIISRT